VTLSVLKEITLTYKLVSLAWSSSRNVVFIDAVEQAHVIDVRTAEELEAVDLASIGLAYNTSLWKSVDSSTGVSRALTEAGQQLCYESVASLGGQLIILGMTGVHVFSVRTWIERLNVLVRRRQFADALTLAETFYIKSVALSSDDVRGRQAKRRDKVAERILELLAKYIDHVDAVSSLHSVESNTISLYHVRICLFCIVRSLL